MGLEILLDRYLNQNIQVQAASTPDQYGTPTWASTTAASTYACLIVQKVASIRDRNGVNTVSNAQIYLSGNTTIHIDDKITLPDATQPLIIAVQKYPDFTGSTNILTEVYT